MDLLGARRFPFLTRRNFLNEFRHIIPWSILAGLVEGQFAAVVVAKTFQGGPLLIALATTTPYAAYVFSLIWGMVCVGRRKIRLLVFFGFGTCLSAAVIAAIPATRFGAWWFLAQIGLAQAMLAGVVTVRSAMWRSNYPREVRGQIASRLQGVRSVISVITVQVASAIGDADPQSYRVVFPLAALAGFAGVCLLPRIRIRGERAELRRRRQPAPDDGHVRRGWMEPYNLTALLSPGHVFGQAFRVLHEDRRFSVYCVAQFLHGAANLMSIPVVVAVVTRDLPLENGWSFWISSSLVVTIPTLCLLGSLGRWGRLFDSLGVLRFRVINVITWSLSLLFGLLATVAVTESGPGGSALLAGVMLLALRGVLQGVGQGGGSLAWNLGHLHFADSDRAELYMGIHVFLAGVRGLTAPLLGMWLWEVIGWPVWLVALALSLTSLQMYSRLARFDEFGSDKASA